MVGHAHHARHRDRTLVDVDRPRSARPLDGEDDPLPESAVRTQFMWPMPLIDAFCTKFTGTVIIMPWATTATP